MVSRAYNGDNLLLNQGGERNELKVQGEVELREQLARLIRAHISRHELLERLRLIEGLS